MFDITEEDIKKLVKIYKNNLINKDGSTLDGLYTFEYIVECGLKYIYGEKHVINGRLIECKASFKEDLKNRKEHECKKEFITFDPTPLKIEGRMEHAEWTVFNLAIITDKDILYAYYRKQKLFDFHADKVTALYVSNNVIVMGKNTGQLSIIEPAHKNTTTTQRHEKAITKIIEVNDKLITSSEDGSIYINNKLKLSEGEIINCVIANNAIYCACKDNSVIVTKPRELNKNILEVVDISEVEVVNIMSHTDRITNITANGVVCTSSEDGHLGIYKNALVKLNVDGTQHVQNETTIYSYGRESIIAVDVATLDYREVYRDTNGSIKHLTMHKNIIIFTVTGEKGSSTNLIFLDVNSEMKYVKDIGKEIKDIKLSQTGEHLFLETVDGSFICDVVVQIN